MIEDSRVARRSHLMIELTLCSSCEIISLLLERQGSATNSYLQMRYTMMVVVGVEVLRLCEGVKKK
jgi:hypothetical protein